MRCRQPALTAISLSQSNSSMQNDPKTRGGRRARSHRRDLLAKCTLVTGFEVAAIHGHSNGEAGGKPSCPEHPHSEEERQEREAEI